MMSRSAGLVATLAVIASSALLGASPSPGSGSPSDEALKDWHASCGYCHGKPRGAPELRGRRLPPDLIIAFARKGATGMPVFHRSELDDARLLRLAQWISRQPLPKPAK